MFMETGSFEIGLYCIYIYICSIYELYFTRCLYIIHVKNLILIANILRDRGNAEVGVYYYRECFARSQRRFRGFSKKNSRVGPYTGLESADLFSVFFSVVHGTRAESEIGNL